MNNVSMLLLVTALIVPTGVSASDRFAVQTEVTRSGKIVSTGTREVENGGIAQFSDGRFKETDAKVTTTCRSGLSRWLHPFKPACDEVVEKEQTPIGFIADITPRVMSDGRIGLVINGKYVLVLGDSSAESNGGVLHTANFRPVILASTLSIKIGEKAVIRSGPAQDEVVLTVQVDRL